jgi:hypothetical protein
MLDFDGPTPSAADLSARWHQAVEEARELIRLLPAESAGRCVLDHEGGLQRAAPDALQRELRAGQVAFHEGRIRGAWPEILEAAAQSSKS